MADSLKFTDLQRASVRDVKAVGMTSAATSLELVGYIRQLESLVFHCQIHSGYPNCGYNQMESDQKEIYDGIVATNAD